MDDQEVFLPAPDVGEEAGSEGSSVGDEEMYGNLSAMEDSLRDLLGEHEGLGEQDLATPKGVAGGKKRRKKRGRDRKREPEREGSSSPEDAGSQGTGQNDGAKKRVKGEGEGTPTLHTPFVTPTPTPHGTEGKPVEPDQGMGGSKTNGEDEGSPGGAEDAGDLLSAPQSWAVQMEAQEEASGTGSGLHEMTWDGEGMLKGNEDRV